MLPIVGCVLNVVAGFALVILGSRGKSKQMLLLGVLVLLGTLLMGWTEFRQGVVDGYND